jgi:hypothetical protein
MMLGKSIKLELSLHYLALDPKNLSKQEGEFAVVVFEDQLSFDAIKRAFETIDNATKKYEANSESHLFHINLKYNPFPG